MNCPNHRLSAGNFFDCVPGKNAQHEYSEAASGVNDVPDQV